MGRQPHARLVLIHRQLITLCAQQLLQSAGYLPCKRRQRLNGPLYVHIPGLQHRNIVSSRLQSRHRRQVMSFSSVFPSNGLRHISVDERKSRQQVDGLEVGFSREAQRGSGTYHIFKLEAKVLDPAAG